MVYFFNNIFYVNKIPKKSNIILLITGTESRRKKA